MIEEIAKKKLATNNFNDSFTLMCLVRSILLGRFCRIFESERTGQLSSLAPLARGSPMQVRVRTDQVKRLSLVS
jgi:hypothetical protein